MATNRNAIKQALLAKLQAVTFPRSVNGQNTWIAHANPRRLVMFNKLDPSQQPTFFLVQHTEVYEQTGIGTPSRRYLKMGAWCYASAMADSDVGDEMLDSMIEGIENALKPDNPQTNELTLGGLVYWCRIKRDSNMFIRDPGDINGQALLVLPIDILIP